MRKDYQTGIVGEAIASPDEVVIAMCDIRDGVEGGFVALAVATGMSVMTKMMNADVTAICGPKGRHNPERTAVRHGSEDGSVTLGGRRVPVRRPRLRTADGTAEVA